MIVQILYNRGTAAERDMAGLAAQLAAAKVTCELLDADSPAGISVAEHYDVLARPAILLVRHDGTLDEMWTELDRFPSVDTLRYRAST